jgi:hypothetical protein
MSKRVVLTVSGFIAADIHERIANGQRPRADYLELARGFDSDILDYAAARETAGWIGRILSWVGGPNLVLAYACWKVRSNYQAIVTDGEQIGLPLAALLKFTPGGRPRHIMIVHVISEPKKTFFLDWLGVQSCIDRFVTYSRWQQQFIQSRWKLVGSRVSYAGFWVTGRSGGVVCRHVDDLDAVAESDTCNHLRQLICTFEPPPGFRCSDHQFEHHQPGGR